MSALALQRIRECKETRSTRLDLGNCGLTELPDELFELVWLEVLLLSSGDFEYTYEENQWQLFRSQNLGEKNNLKSLNSLFSKMVSLKSLFLGGDNNVYGVWDISDISPLESLTNLRQLGINYARITDLSPIKSISSLEILHLKNTYVKNIDYLKDLSKLRELSLSGNFEISDISSLSNLLNLEHLSISGTNVKDLKPLSSLVKLTFLACSDFIEDINPLQELTNLKTLALSYSKVIDFKSLSNLTNLERLTLKKTSFNDLNILKKLLKLKELDIRFTSIDDLSSIKGIIKKGIPIFLESNGLGIDIEGCPIHEPPLHIIEQGNAAILRYWQELETKETQTNNQTKLIFVGNSRAGKTSLWQFLKDKIYNEQADSTHGIKTEIWDKETLDTEDNQNLAAHIWDFGGQEYYHATHRLFLADNAVYVLVWEKESNKQGTRLEKFKLDDDPNGEIEEVELEHFPASYWLENIAYFAGKHCPVLVVQNKVDEELLKANYTDGVQEINDCFHLSVQNAFGFQEGNTTLKRHDFKFQDFKERLLELLRKNATSFPLVKYYGEVRKRLEGLSKNNEYITINDLEKIANEEDETKTPDLKSLLAYLKSFTNTILYFPQNPFLHDRLFLNPTHISRDIYKILNKTVRDNKGKFDLAHIKTRLNLPNYEEAERFLALMHEFDLIFEKQDENDDRTFIAPQYLQQKAHLATGEKMMLKTFQPAFYVRFKSFVPRSMMLRFIAQNGASAFEEFYWRNGIVYQGRVPNTFIKVEYDSEARTFSIDVQDKDKQAVDMQQVVAQFVKLNNSDDNIDISNDGKTYIELKTIRKLQHENRRDDIFIDGHVVSLYAYNWLINHQKTEESMTIEQLKEKVHAHIKDARTKEAMDEIAAWAHEHNQEQLKSDLTLLIGDYTQFKRDNILGLKSPSETDAKQNQLRDRVLKLLDSIEVSIYLNNNPIENKSQKVVLQNIEDKKIAKKLLQNQMDIYLNEGLDYYDFWESELSSNITDVCKEFFESFKTFDENKNKVNDFMGISKKSNIRLYGYIEIEQQERVLANEIKYDQIIGKSLYFIDDYQSKDGKPLMSTIGISCENGFQNWHWEYLRLFIEEYKKYKKNTTQYSFKLLSKNNVSETIDMNEKILKPLSVFISYSKSDDDLRKELHTHLSSLRRRNIVSNWDDRHIIGGELWDETIKTKLKEADIILFLVSANFINTDYIWNHEIPIAEEQRKNGKARVIPIILKACQWTKLDFAKQQALPSKGVPINSFPDRDAVWLEVVESIEKVINDLMK